MEREGKGGEKSKTGTLTCTACTFLPPPHLLEEREHHIQSIDVSLSLLPGRVQAGQDERNEGWHKLCTAAHNGQLDVLQDGHMLAHNAQADGARWASAQAAGSGGARGQRSHEHQHLAHVIDEVSGREREGVWGGDRMTGRQRG